MFRCASGIEQVKKAAMLFTLLMFPVVVQAEPADVTVSGNHATKADSELESKVADLQQNFKFPRWPGYSRSASREMIPPPPPGPYMSSALKEFSVKGSSFGRDSDNYEANKPVFKLDRPNIPMETFSPDRPWPERVYKKHTRNRDCYPICAPTRWMPENGYHYVDPRVKK